MSGIDAAAMSGTFPGSCFDVGTCAADVFGAVAIATLRTRWMQNESPIENHLMKGSRPNANHGGSPDLLRNIRCPLYFSVVLRQPYSIPEVIE